MYTIIHGNKNKFYLKDNLSELTSEYFANRILSAINLSSKHAQPSKKNYNFAV